MKLGNAPKIAIGWTILTAAGIYSFYLSKKNITSKRYEHMKVRERMKLANTGEYEQSPRKYARTE